MTMPQVWVVMGTTGEYGDRNEWLVEAHASASSAEVRARFLCDAAGDVGVASSPRPEKDVLRALSDAFWDAPTDDAEGAYRAAVAKLSPTLADALGNHRIDYTGVEFFVMGPIPLVTP